MDRLSACPTMPICGRRIGVARIRLPRIHRPTVVTDFAFPEKIDMPRRAKTSVLTSAELLKQSEALRRQAEELKRKEIPEVVGRIKEAIAHYGLTAADLGLAAAPRKAATKVRTATVPSEPSAKSKPAKKATTIKYRDSAGNTWSGRGPKPKWFKDALAAGTTEDSLQA